MKNFFTITFHSFLYAIAIVCLCGNWSALQAQTLAFPGAEGFGRYTEGARGVASPEVYIVTNLNDSGAGSFRDAVSQPGRFVVFAVSGIIKLESQVAIKPNITIAGQTAPGDGIVLFGKRVTFTGSSNTIARYLRIRLGADGNGKNDDASGISNGENMILDHMSFTWGLDEVFSINWDGNNPSINNITVQNSIIGQGLHRHNHSAGGLIQPPGGISLIKNLYISNKTRNPKVKGINEFVNNVVYNYGNYGNEMGHTVSGEAYILGGDSQGISEANIINNYFIGGPLTPPSKTTPFSSGNANFKLYGSGNYFDNNKDGILNGTLVPYNGSGYPGVTVFNAEPYDYPAKSVSLTAEEAFQHIIENVGPRYPRLDQVDALLINEVASKGTEGMYVYRETDLPFANGGVGELFQGPIPVDSDSDGLPDAWEDAHGLDKNNASDAVAASTEEAGYLNIEVYINSLMDTPAPDFLRPPTEVIATATSTTEIELSWADNTDSEENYILQRSADGTEFTDIAELPANTTTYTDTELVSKTEYHYRLKAVNATEESAFSQPVPVKTMGVPDAPSAPAPANESIYSQSNNLNLAWTGSADTDTYKVYFGTDAGNLTLQGDVSLQEYIISDIAENTSYFWRVDAVNEIGTTEGPVWSFETLSLATAELVAHYSFDASSGTLVEDETVYGNDGTISGISSPEWVAGKMGNALDMSNAAGISDAFITIPSNNQNYFDENSFTISLWVKINSTYSYADEDDAYFIHKGTFEAGTGKWYGIQLKDETLTFAIDDGSTKSSISEAVGAASAHNLFNNEWKHIVAIRDKENSQIKMYINGVLAEQGSASTGTIGKSDALKIGNSAENRPFHDLIDEVKLFNYALSETEIGTLYNVDEPVTPKAANPSPAHQAANINPEEELALSWTSSATSFNVYKGTSAEALTMEVEALDEAAYAFAELEEGTTYYWRVDAITDTETISGDVWSFTTSVPVATGDLVGHWKLNEAAGLSAADASPYENHGQLTNLPDPQWVEGYADNALDMSNAEVDAHIRVPNGQQIFFNESSFTISFWMKAEPSIAGNGAYLFHKGAFGVNDAGGTGQWMGLEVKDGLIRFAVDDNVTKTEATVPDNSPFFNGEWVHVVTVRDTENDKLRIYRNGEQVVEQNDGTNTPIGTALPLLIGNNYNLDGAFMGMLDDFRIYDYTMGAAEIASLYSGERVEFIVTDPAPFDGAEALEPDEVVLEWTGSAESYDLYVGTSETALTLEAEGLTQSTYTLTELERSATYFWRIDPVVGTESETGDIWSFTIRDAVSTAGIIAPAHNAVATEPISLSLSWTGNAATYDLYMGTDENSLELLAENLTMKSYTVDQLDFGTTYYWRIDATTGTETANGDVWSFTTRQSINKASGPIPAHETENMEVEGLVLNWEGDADRYIVYMGENPENLEQKSPEINDPSYEIFWALNPGTTYYWRVDAVKGQEVQQGDVWTFTTLSPTGMAALNAEQGFKCYPNPFTDRLTVEFSLKKYDTVELSLYDNQNRLIHSWGKAGYSEGTHKLNFSAKDKQLSKLGEGIYYVVLQTSGQKLVQKLVNLK